MPSTPSTDVDIAICGAGPVGLTLAALLIQRGIAPNRIALIDAKSIEQAMQDPRSIALSYGSKQIIDDIDAWPAASDAIRQIHVSRRGHFGRTLIDHQDYQLPALGYVTRYGNLVRALAAATETRGLITLRPATVIDTREDDTMVTLQLSTQRTLTSKILVQAEGGVFGAQTGKTLQRDYQQSAIVAHVTTSAAVAARAFERFADEGPLALLPQENGYALVWCMRPASAEKIAALSDADFLTQLSQAFGTRVGRFLSATPRHAYPLGLNAHPASSARIVAIGNAAQTLHPVAGQGLNLGLRDATMLARLLAQDITPSSLHKYATTRQADRKLTIQLTDAMARAFASAADGALTQTVLGLSLGLIDACPPAKHMLARQMMFGWR